MRNRISTLALAAVLAVGASGIALAQTCPVGYWFDGAYCQPGGVVGGAANAAGAIVGGAVNTAGAIAAGTVGAVTGQPPYYGSSVPPPAPACPPGYVLYSTGCYPAR